MQNFSYRELRELQEQGLLGLESFCHEHGGFWACPCQLCKEENLGEEIYPTLADDEPVDYVRQTD